MRENCVPCIETAPRFVAGTDERDPLKLPIGVLATPTLHASKRERERTDHLENY